MQCVTKQPALADVFAEDSENEQSFHGFSDTEISDHLHANVEPEDKDTSGAFTFRLRVALRPASSTQELTDEEEEGGEEEIRTKERSGQERTENTSQAKRKRRVEFKVEPKERAASRPPPSEERAVDSGEDVPDCFLAKREQNIKANKAMLSQLMAELQKMPGGAGFLKKQADKQKRRERGSRPLHSGGESRKNSERASRRQTRSMGGAEGPSAPKQEELELSFEELLLESRGARRRRGAPRPAQCKPHHIRPVEDIIEDEIQLVADNMTDKVYNRVTGSTCHQCRQKTVDTKTCCRSEDCRGIQGQFCGPCLRNRYGEDARKALLDPEWKCPPCRGICNCSFCRQREGRCPTGILFPLAQYHGFSDVHSYLSSLRNKLKNEDDDVEM